MTRSLVTLSTLTIPILHVYLATGCSGQFAAGAGARGPVLAAPEEMAEVDEGSAPVGPAHASGEDRHWMQADDYFISEVPWQQSWIYVHLSKMKRPPGPGTKDQALFFQLDDSREVWTQHYWRTRPAGPDDLELGELVLCFNDSSQGNVYQAPQTKDKARTGKWFMGRITDVSDVFKGVVQVDTYSCAVDAVRAVAPARAADR